jgi:hypothetical protein
MKKKVFQLNQLTSIKCVRCFRSSSNRNQVASNPAPKLTIYIQKI